MQAFFPVGLSLVNRIEIEHLANFKYLLLFKFVIYLHSLGHLLIDRLKNRQKSFEKSDKLSTAMLLISTIICCHLLFA